jgi:inner membrane protein
MRIAFKALMVFVLTLAVLIPLEMIRGTVEDRQRFRAEAVAEVARSTAGAQSLEGPVLLVPYSDRIVATRADADGVGQRVEQVKEGLWVFFADSLDLRGTLRPLPRMRGIHEVRVFELDTVQQAAFDVQIPQDDDPATPRTIGEPMLGFGIRDVRGLVGTPSLRVMGTQQELVQGLGHGRSGVHARLPAPAPGAVLRFTVEFTSTVQGTESLAIAPLAERNVISLESAWPHPQFNRDFLPRTREVGADGFSARWEISSLASNAQSQFRAALEKPAAEQPIDAIGVSLIDPVNVHSQVDRATKYGVLFVLLTFVSFFMFEFLKQLRIHPIQYGLVGLAVAIFFLLLLALSERIAFGLAYVAATIACVALIGYYLGHVLGGWGRGAGFAGMLGTLYAALYGLLISEDNAMVLGAGLLFLILGTIMVATRKVDWYRVAALPPR